MDLSRVGAVVFDIDGTILRPGCALQSAHMNCMAAAIERETGIATEFRHCDGDLIVHDHSLSGYTDAGTIDLVLRLGGVPPSRRAALRQRIVDAMCHELAEAVRGLDAQEDLLPSVAALVAELRDRAVVIGLSTGNARAVATLKMRATGLHGLETLGGFGDVHLDRSAVVRAAVASVRADAATTAGPDRFGILVIGDTPSDVHSARAAGVRSLAVCTGAASMLQLCEARPDALVASLAEVCGGRAVEDDARPTVVKEAG